MVSGASAGYYVFINLSFELRSPSSHSWLQCLSTCTNLVSYKWARANYQQNESTLSVLRNCRSLRVIDNAPRWVYRDTSARDSEPVVFPPQGLMHIGVIVSAVDFPSFNAWAQRYFRTLTSLKFEVLLFTLHCNYTFLMDRENRFSANTHSSNRHRISSLSH